MTLLMQYLRRYRMLILLALLLAAINQIFSLMDPYIFGRIVDRYATKASHYLEPAFIHGVLLLIGAALGVAMVSRVAKAFQDYVTNVIIQKFGAQIYTDGLKHSLQLPYQQFEDQRSGETLSILQQVRSDCEKFITSFVSVLFTSAVGIVFVMIYAFRVYWLLVPVYFAGSLLLGVLTNILSKRIKKIQRHIVRETTMLAGSTTESLRNIELVKSLGLTDQEIERLNSTTLKILGMELRKVRSIRSISFVQGTFVNLLRQSILFILLYLIFKGHVTVGQLFTLQLYSFFIFGPLQELGNIILSYREAEASLTNFRRLMDSPVEVQPIEPIHLGPLSRLEFRDLSFRHLSGTGWALEDIRFEARQGDTIAFVGPSGSGKTTLVKLLVGLYTPQQGQVLYNGIAADRIRMEELRQQLGLVTQDTQLFAGSIRENLLFVNPKASEQQMLTALDQAACQSLLARAERGIDTLIGEGGMKISGGERQRLSIARALLRRPGLLIFDEATSALDSITEEEITRTVKSIAGTGSRITVMIAHRLSTILHADRIYVLEKGRIVETGTHSSLLLEKGLYYAMWRQQIGERKEVPSAQPS